MLSVIAMGCCGTGLQPCEDSIGAAPQCVGEFSFANVTNKGPDPGLHSPWH